MIGVATTALPPTAHAQQLTTPLIDFSILARPRRTPVLWPHSERASVKPDIPRPQCRDRIPLGPRRQWPAYRTCADLVRRQVAVIVSALGTATALAAKAATTTIPIVFSPGTDPVGAGIVASLSRPGGNITGVNLMVRAGRKTSGYFAERCPRHSIALLVNRTNPVAAESVIKDVERAASATARQIEVFDASTSREIETAFAALVQKRAEALVVGADPFFIDRRVQLATLATRHLLPTIYQLRAFVEVGGLVSYGASDFVRYREVGIYTGRILKGEKPADMPVVQATKFELVINLPTARAIGITVSQSLLAQADEVIE